MYHVLLYYKYVEIAEPEAFAARHLKLCKRLGLKGRIIVAPEGINGTLSGPREATDEYRQILTSEERFADMDWKVDESDGHVFEKLFVRAKQEIVTLRYDGDLDPNRQTGKYLSPSEFQRQLESGDAIVLDGRSEYEYDLGHFANAIRPDIQTFREFPDWIRDNMLDFRDRPILTYCTGGIRCEKLTALLIEQGFSDVAQLKGGIVTYGKDPEARGKYFHGKCYVFDERIGVAVNQDESVVVSSCKHCGKPCDRYINCARLACHAQYFACVECQQLAQGFCSNECVGGRTEKLQPEEKAKAMQKVKARKNGESSQPA